VRTRTTVIAFLSAVVAATSLGLVAATAPAVVVDRTIDSGITKATDLTLSADARLVAVGGSNGYGIWDAQSGSSIRRDPAAGTVTRLAFSPQGTLIAVGGSDGRVGVIDLRSGDRKEVAKHGKAVRSVAFGPGGSLGASGDAEGTILLWDSAGALAGTLKDAAHRAPVIFLGFAGANSLVSLDDEMNVVTWDVNGKRASRHGELQSGVVGRTIVPASAGLDPAGEKLLVGGQLVSQPRGGVLAGRNNLANPGDLRRDNVLIGYAVGTGTSADPIVTGDFKPETVAVSPGGCYALFTSFFRDQPTLHVWGLIEKGDDLLRTDIAHHAVAFAADPAGRAAAAITDTGQVLTWRLSGLTAGDCDAYTHAHAAQAAPPAGEPKISLGDAAGPLLQSGNGARIAVLRFDAAGLNADLGASVSDMVAGQLSNTPGIVVIERSAIDAILKEFEIQRSGLTNADAVKIGKGLNAKTVMLGRLSKFGDDTFVITIRAVNVETQQLEGSREVTCERCKESNLPAAVAALKRVLVK
jgi:hypothetical protein